MSASVTTRSLEPRQPLLDAGHPGEEVRHLGRGVRRELVRELRVAVPGLLLDEVPATLYSEALRDATLVAEVAGR